MRSFNLSQGRCQEIPRGGGGGARVDRIIRLKNRLLKNALKSFAIFYAYHYIGHSLC